MNIGESLKRKIGPLPVWVWAIAGFALVWYYRNKLSAGSTASGTGTGSVGPTPTTPQPTTVLQPGESVYDPNTGTLSSAPGGTTTADGSGNAATTPPDYTSLVQAIEDAITAGQQATGGAGGAGAGTSGGQAAVAGPAPAATSATITNKPRLTARGAVFAPFGHRRPAPRQGYTVKGLGRGWWEYVPTTSGRRTPKPKTHHGGPKATSKPPAATVSKPRSGASVRNSVAGRTTTRVKAGVRPSGRVRGGAKPHATQPRQISTRRATPIVSRPVIRQRPVATVTPRPQHVQPSTHRTASTPPRTASRRRGKK